MWCVICLLENWYGWVFWCHIFWTINHTCFRPAAFLARNFGKSNISCTKTSHATSGCCFARPVHSCYSEYWTNVPVIITWDTASWTAVQVVYVVHSYLPTSLPGHPTSGVKALKETKHWTLPVSWPSSTTELLMEGVLYGCCFWYWFISHCE